MPNPPRTKITIEDVNVQFYQLSEINYIISDGYRYRLDWEKYHSCVRRAYEYMKEVEGNLPSWSAFLATQGVELDSHEQYLERQHQQDLQNAREIYLDALEKCDIVDEDGKICGDYYRATKHYEMIYRRFVSDENVYYRDEYNDVWTCGHSYVGHLKDDGITIDYDNLFTIARDAWE